VGRAVVEPATNRLKIAGMAIIPIEGRRRPAVRHRGSPLTDQGAYIMSTPYDHDFYAWLQDQATLLKAGRLAELDIDHLIEEIESMGASERRELINRLRILLVHLLKWQFQPDARSSGWRGTIIEQRRQLETLLGQSPSLRHLVPEAMADAYPKARDDAADETGLAPATFPDICPYSIDQTLTVDYWPD
jgi:hypothetical protein